MLCYVMLCYVVLCYVMLRCVVLRYVVLCYVTLCYVTLCLRYVVYCSILRHLKRGGLFLTLSEKNRSKYADKQTRELQNISMLLFCLFYFLRKERESIVSLHLPL